MKGTINSMQINYRRHKMARNKSLLKNTPQENSSTQWLSSIAIPIEALPNDGPFKIWRYLVSIGSGEQNKILQFSNS